jgi:hypothetical protein
LVLVIGVLALLVSGAFLAVACGWRGIDVWVWDWAPLVVRQRTRSGAPWRSLTTMRIQFGIIGLTCLGFAVHLLAR